MQNIHCNIHSKEIQPAEVFAFIQHPEHGGQNIFLGSVRAHNLGKEVIAVEYEAYIPFAQHTLLEIAHEAHHQWGSSLKIYTEHRVGKLLCGDISVAIGVSAPHRSEAYEASRYIIEQIKIRSPIWKKEYYTTGETEWVKGHALCQHHHT